METKTISRRIRKAEGKDYLKILEILNQAITERRFTALLTPATLEKRRDWFREHSDEKHPIFVCEENEEIIGWMAVSAYRDGREGFSNACEISYYIDKDNRHRGVATDLIEYVMEASKRRGIKDLMAVVFSDNTYSRALLEKHGFSIWGRFPGIVEIDGVEKDCLQYGKRIS